MRLWPARLLAALLVSATVSAQRAGSDVTTEQILNLLNVHEGATACEIGAGDGTLSIAAARVVGPKGRVYTSELGESRVKSLEADVAASGLTQITTVSGDPNKTNFPNGACDVLFMRNVYHHFADPAAMDASIFASVKPGARVVVSDFRPRGEEAARPADRGREGASHGVLPESVARELKAAGFEPVSLSREPTTAESPPDQQWFIVVMAKPAPGAPGAGSCSDVPCTPDPQLRLLPIWRAIQGRNSADFCGLGMCEQVAAGRCRALCRALTAAVPLSWRVAPFASQSSAFS